jgi:hypothetical protein
MSFRLFVAAMRLDKAGLPFIGGALVLAVVTGAAAAWWLAIPFLALAAFFAFFFRDPHRVSPTGNEVVLSPADGRVLVAGPADPAAAPAGVWQQISIFCRRWTAREPYPRGGPRHQGELHAGDGFFLRIITTRRARTSAARSGSITEAS